MALKYLLWLIPKMRYTTLYFTWSQFTELSYIFSNMASQPREGWRRVTIIVTNQLKLHINGYPITKLVPNLYRHLQTSIVYNTASICLFLTSTFHIHTLYIYTANHSLIIHTCMICLPISTQYFVHIWILGWSMKVKVWNSKSAGLNIVLCDNKSLCVKFFQNWIIFRGGSNSLKFHI